MQHQLLMNITTGNTTALGNYKPIEGLNHRAIKDLKQLPVVMRSASPNC